MRAGGAPKNPYDGIIQNLGKYPRRRGRNGAHQIMTPKRGKKHDEHSSSQEIEGKPEIEWNQQQSCSPQRKRDSNLRNKNGMVSDAMRMELSNDNVDMGVSGNGIYHASHYGVSSKQKRRTVEGESGTACRNEHFSPNSYESECGGEEERKKPIGWSVMNTKVERREVTQSDEEQMLQLSQGSMVQEGVLTGRPLSPSPVTFDTKEIPEKRRKRENGGTRKRPRCASSPHLLARDIFELLQPELVPSEGKHFADSRTENTGEIHGKKTSSCLTPEGQEDHQCLKFDKDVKRNRNSDTSLEQDLMEQQEASDHDNAIEDLPSSEPSKKVVITVRCKCPSECRHFISKAKQQRQFGGGSPRCGSNLQASSPGKPRKLDRRSANPENNATCAGEDSLRETILRERGGVRSSRETYCDKTNKDGKRMTVISATHGVTSPGELEGTSEDRMHVNGLLQSEVGSQNCSAPSSNRDESSTVEPQLLSGEDGHSLSREAVQIGRELRQTLLGHSNYPENNLPPPRAGSQSLECQDTIGQAASREEKRSQPSCEGFTENKQRNPQKAMTGVPPIERDKNTKPNPKNPPEVKQSELSPSKAKRWLRRTNKKATATGRKEQLRKERATIAQEGSQRTAESDEAENLTHIPFTQTRTEPTSPSNQAKNNVKAHRKKPRSRKPWPQDNEGAGVTDARGLDGGEERHAQQQKVGGTEAESSKTVGPNESSSKNPGSHSSNCSHDPKTNNMSEKRSGEGAETPSSEPVIVRSESFPVPVEGNRRSSELPTVRKKSTISQRLEQISDMEAPIKPVLDGSIMDVDNYAAQTEEVKAMQAGRKSRGEDLEDLVDRKVLRKQSQLVRRSTRLRNSRRGGSRHEGSNKALDELSDNEDSKNNIRTPPIPASRSRSRPSTARVEKERTHSMTTRRRASQFSGNPDSGAAVIDLTDSGDDEKAAIISHAAPHDDDIAENLKELQRLSLQDKSKAVSDRPRCKYLTPLSSDESELATQLVTQTKLETRIVTIAEAKITLLGESFKRLRGTRWLNDELLNAYVSLINSRNDAVFRELSEEHRSGIPRTYVFNTYFFTRLCPPSSGFDYPGVKGWTRRAKVDILQKDIILVPINLGDHHWVLSLIDMEHREFSYLDSMHGPDTAKALSKLKRWVFEELRHKHGESVAHQYDPESWKEIKHYYRVRRIGVLPASLEAREAKVGRMTRVPKQRDGGSCGVFTAKLADCLSLGIKVYFKQTDIPLIRRRMALDLFRGYLPL